MAYGNGNKDLLHKAIPIGVGDLTSTKLSDLRLLREKYIEAARAMTDLVFVAEPLAEAIDKATIDKKLCAFQKGYTGFNKAYLGKARIAVTGAIAVKHSRARSAVPNAMRMRTPRTQLPTICCYDLCTSDKRLPAVRAIDGEPGSPEAPSKLFLVGEASP